VVASCSSRTSLEEDSIALTSISTDSAPERFSHDHNLRRSNPPTEAAVPTAVAFGGKSRYVLCGDDSGAVCLWDLKKKARVRHFFHDGPSLQVAMTDAEVMSLSPLAFHVFDLRQSTLLCKINGDEYTCFAMSKTTVVALGRSDGNLDVVDWRDPESLQTPTAPFASPITCLAISPANPNLLAASRQDGQLAFLDIRTGETIQTIQVEDSISSLSFHVDGILCAVGTETGRVLLYDLRAPDRIVAGKDFDEPIVALEFAPRASSGTARPLSMLESLPTAAVGESAVAVPRAQPAAKAAPKDEDHTSSISTSMDKAGMEEIVQDAVDQLRDEIGSTIRSLHVDMLRQFQMQSDEFTSLLTTQMTAMEHLMAENEKLREDNKKLRNKA
jgi:WD40 repeat protein